MKGPGVSMCGPDTCLHKYNDQKSNNFPSPKKFFKYFGAHLLNAQLAFNVRHTVFLAEWQWGVCWEGVKALPADKPGVQY